MPATRHRRRQRPDCRLVCSTAGQAKVLRGGARRRGRGGAGEGRCRTLGPAHSSRLGPPPVGWGRGESSPPPPLKAPLGCQSGGGARRLGRRLPGSGGSMFGCALLKVQLREPLTCLERETAWSLAKRLSEGTEIIFHQ
ncbi:coiled-coil-helix-coiled-coil-helix domain-containing protein 7 isoform X1 [Manis pentadactyla]|uniref:coiled-coil-helix-coiled-coil-helix domain-containing protein 7 isoform X1 n=1 Tax=Manis pentadactyla TaxID=143292 RepID=UPI00255CF0B4|nr:coiled-coil-helix-coiled-coil-helix domain-containing protein 7 isoform X1 [Manis pentadactyla]